MNRVETIADLRKSAGISSKFGDPKLAEKQNARADLYESMTDAEFEDRMEKAKKDSSRLMAQMILGK